MRVRRHRHRNTSATLPVRCEHEAWRTKEVLKVHGGTNVGEGQATLLEIRDDIVLASMGDKVSVGD